MNSLSWFIYFIHIADTARQWTIAIIIMGVATSMISMIAIGIHDSSLLKSEKDQTLFPIWKKWVWRFILIVIPLCIFIQIIFPERKMLLLIAGSEIGERLINSDETRSITDPSIKLLRTWIETETSRLLAQETTGTKK